MMKNARLLSGTTHRVTLPPDASLTLLAENGLDVLLFIQNRPMGEDTSTFIINDQIGGNWGRELRMPCPPEGTPHRFTVSLLFNGTALEIHSAVQSVTMERFGTDHCDGVRYLRSFKTSDPMKSLEFTLEPLESTLTHIEAYLLHRRLDQLEARLGVSPDMASGPGSEPRK